MSDELRLKRVMGLIGDPVGLRILDLACRIGVFSTALANAGADVVGIEGRQENLDEAPASTAQLQIGDVRALPTTLGQFDVVLCLGILYHLNAKEAVALLSNLATMAKKVIVDTHTSGASNSTIVDGQTYYGHMYVEPVGVWSSLDFAPSWWFTPQSLDEVFCNTGWTSRAIPGEAYPGEPGDRLWYVLEATS